VFLHRPEYDRYSTEWDSKARRPLSVRTCLEELFGVCICENEIGLMFRLPVAGSEMGAMGMSCTAPHYPHVIRALLEF
jgi:hypothetical protein